MQNSTNKQTEFFWKRVLFTSVPLILLFAAFAEWVFTKAPADPLAVIAAAVSAFLFALLGIRFIPQWMAAWSRKPWLPVRAQEGKRSARKGACIPCCSWFSILGCFASCSSC